MNSHHNSTHTVPETASQNAAGASAGPCGNRASSDEGERPAFRVNAAVARGARGRPHERQVGEPLYRKLRIYTVDPGTRQDEGAIAVVNVPWEPLEDEDDEKGHVAPKKDFKGSVFQVAPVAKRPASENATRNVFVDLNDRRLMQTQGCAPSPVDPEFHQQMVYAVASLVYASFQHALGRHIAWGIDPDPNGGGRTRLLLSPHGRPGHAGAAYDRKGGEISFGFVQTENEPRGRAAPNGHTFACVSHDIVTHEVTHALLDGLRAHFLEPTSADVLGFHEGFADVVALLHRFSYKEVVRAAVRRARGRVLQSELLTTIAREFGLNVGKGGALRSLDGARERETRLVNAANGNGAPGQTNGADAHGAAKSAQHGSGDDKPVVPTYRENMDPHEMGEVFVSAVLNAFAMVYSRKIERYLRLATNGTGVLPPGDLSFDLQEVLVEEASQLATQFLNVCIRAIDYCPPVDLQLGEFLRAVITADMDLVPDDPWGYREAWIDAFADHRIFPRGVQSMSEDALRWDFIPSTGISREMSDNVEADAVEDESQPPVVEELSFARLQFDGDPAFAANEDELKTRAEALGKFVTASAKKMAMFGLLLPGDDLLANDEGLQDWDDVSPPEVQSIRTSRRVGPDGQVVFDLVAEVTQTRWVNDGKFLFRGGCTVILGPRGEVRYIIKKSVGQNGRVFRQRKFMLNAGQDFVTLEDGWNVPDAEMVQFAHQHD